MQNNNNILQYNVTNNNNKINCCFTMFKKHAIFFDKSNKDQYNLNSNIKIISVPNIHSKKKLIL